MKTNVAQYMIMRADDGVKQGDKAKCECSGCRKIAKTIFEVKRHGKTSFRPRCLEHGTNEATDRDHRRKYTPIAQCNAGWYPVLHKIAVAPGVYDDAGMTYVPASRYWTDFE